MSVYIEQIIGIHVVGSRGFDFLGLGVQGYRIAYYSENGNIVDPIAYMSASGRRDPCPCAIFSQTKSLVRQRLYLAGHDSVLDADLGSNVAFEPEPLNQVRAQKIRIVG